MNDFVGYIDSDGKIFDGTFDYEGHVGPIGPQGPAGYTPVRGVDYWTEADQNYIVAEATSLINGKIEEYNSNCVAKTSEFDTNASNKTDAFNSNASSKTTEFNNNAISKTGTFNDNAASKTSNYDANYLIKLNSFDSNATSKKKDYNDNAVAKMNTFNLNATNKTNAFDGHVDEEFNELTGNFYTKTQIDGFGYGTYSKPSGGIPSTDMSNDVQVSLGKADTAVQDVSGKEDLSNKVTSISGSSTDDQYPSAKLLYDQLALKHNTSDGDLIKKLTESSYDMWELDDGIYQKTRNGKQYLYYTGGDMYELYNNEYPLLFVYSSGGAKHYIIFFLNDDGHTKFEIFWGIADSDDGTKNVSFDDRYESLLNKVTSISSSSTNTQYPSAKLLYDELQAKQAEIDQLYDQIPTATATGETINVQDSSNLPIKDFAMLGNATQVTTTGKQLLDINNLNYGFSNVASSYNNLSTIEKGIRYNSTFNNGTPIVMFKIIDLNNYIGKTVRMKSNFTTKGEIRLGTANSDLTSRTQKASTYTSGTEISFTVTNDMGNNHYLTYALAIRSIASTGDTVDFTNLVITIDNADMTYEPYTGGKASPNPDYPQDIHVVTGDNTVKVLGKNLLKATNGSTTNRGIKGTISNYNELSYTGTASAAYSNFVASFPLKLKADTTYTFSIDNALGGNARLSLYLSGGTSQTITIAENTTSKTFVANGTNTTAYMALSNLTTNTSYSGNVKMQIEVGSTATPYEPYTEQTQLLSLGNIELAKIGDYADRVFKSGDKWYVEKATKKVNLAELTWTTYKTDGYTSNTLSDILIPSSTSAAGDIIATKYIARQQSGTITNGYIAISSTTQLLCVDTTGTPTGTAYYVLATPTTTEITDTTLIAQLENVLKMHTNKNVTNASIEPSGSNAQAGLAVVYRKDLQTITDKIDSLEARVSLLE